MSTKESNFKEQFKQALISTAKVISEDYKLDVKKLDKDLSSKIFVTNLCHSRTTPSTCGSYITSKKIFDEDYNDHTGINTPIGDHHKWIFLGKTKNRFILTPIPGLSTHCMEGLLSPTINWSKI